MSGKVTRSTEERFWEKVDKSSTSTGCWLWIAARNEHGYGCFWWNGRLGKAHRYAYESMNGSIPHGQVIDHLCFVPQCVNPDHLRAVSVKQNMEHRQGPNRDGKSGIRNVSWNKARRKWEVRVRHNGRHISGGYFDNIADADDRATALRGVMFSHDDGVGPLCDETDDEGKAIARAAEHDDTDPCD